MITKIILFLERIYKYLTSKIFLLPAYIFNIFDVIMLILKSNLITSFTIKNINNKTIQHLKDTPEWSQKVRKNLEICSKSTNKKALTLWQLLLSLCLTLDKLFEVYLRKQKICDEVSCENSSDGFVWSVPKYSICYLWLHQNTLII